MAKTIYPHEHYSITYGYAVNTTVVSAQLIYNTAVPPVPIGTRVTPISMAGIHEDQLLILGDAQVTLSGVTGSYFTYSPLYVPASGTVIRTPWLAIGAMRYTRAANSISLNYYAPAAHDLYFGTLKTPDSGQITVMLDGQSLGAISLNNPVSTLSSVLLQEDVEPGEHALSITVGFTGPGETFVYFHKIELAEHIRQTGGFYSHLGPTGTLEDSTNNFIGDWTDTGNYAFTSSVGGQCLFLSATR